jgi:DNA-binding response OmpR family regulator
MQEPGDEDESVVHILIVDDDDLVGPTLVAMLEDIGNARLAVDVASALERFEEDERVDVILLDCLLPGGGIARLLDIADERGVPVILISGSSTEIGRIDDSRPCLHKPFSAETMIGLIRTVLRQR